MKVVSRGYQAEKFLKPKARKVSETQGQNRGRSTKKFLKFRGKQGRRPEKFLKSEDSICVLNRVYLAAVWLCWLCGARKVYGASVARLQVDCERRNPGVSEI